jgi:hypothetical protein
VFLDHDFHGGILVPGGDDEPVDGLDGLLVLPKRQLDGA